ncbi:hypothetical protein HBH70_205720 [Parastagonospora nodorum]|nr:hypothetical protein HBH53_203200 [Parastagonospora nodorum]KAH4113849.1 hypothetical protein HBH47_204290 [Parastagonospora nodorum]KAH4154334.1 hypothetical protein HBH43_218170 [Parastagonospora nodorum]KAH4181754.1 hypothetical protein HBH42_230460 [Parastagonospora nodorum]KAH4215930.1 hypothetical protein HBI06_238340 [Parastagonospora nodorum]
MVLVGYNANGHNVPHFDHENAAFPMILSIFVMVGSCLMTLVCVLIYHDSPPQRSRARLGIVVVLAACSLSNVVGFFRFSPKRPEGSESEFQWVPHTGYSIREIDQAVALGIGIATLLLSIYDILRDIRFSPDDEFEFWRSRCIKNIEAGYTEIEITRWRNELDRIDTQAKCQRTRARHRERELKTWKELPKNVMREIENYEVAKRMAAIFVS